MKTFRAAFPYVLDTDLPENIEVLLSERGFDGLSDVMRTGQGWSRVTTDDRMLQVDGKYLLRFLSSKRKPDALAVKRLVDERVEQAFKEGREVGPQLQQELMIQAENEVIKYAPITSSAVYLLLWPEKRLLIASGGTAAKCEDALSYLRKTIGSLAVAPWGDVQLTSNAVTKNMTMGYFTLPANLTISPCGKTVFTGEDASLKIVLDGVKNDTEDAKSMLKGMTARSVEMALIRRPDNGQIKNLADFILHMPPAGNLHFKSYDYDDDAEHEDLHQALIAEIHLVAAYTIEILSALEVFIGVKSVAGVTAQE